MALECVVLGIYLPNNFAFCGKMNRRGLMLGMMSQHQRNRTVFAMDWRGICPRHLRQIILSKV
jgi:hypothetical protein